MLLKHKILIIGSAGYLGVRLRDYLSPLFAKVDGIDWSYAALDKRNAWRYPLDYVQINPQWINRNYDYIILLAGQSSVGLSKDMWTTYEQNVVNFAGLVKKLEPSKKLLYISSASVYGSTCTANIQVESSEDDPLQPPINHYDWSKQVLDYTARGLAPNSIGLRLGTVCGYSSNARLDIIINSLIYSARTKGIMEVNNLDSHRAILGMNDLCRGIKKIIESQWIPGIYNLASFNDTIGGIARNTYAAYQALTPNSKAALMLKEDTGTYSFALDCDKFKRTYNFEFQETVESIVKECINNAVPTPEELHKYVRN